MCPLFFTIFFKKCISSLFRTKYIENKFNLKLFFLPIFSWTVTLAWATTHFPPSQNFLFWKENPSWHSNVVTRSKMRVVPLSVSEVVTTLLSDVIKTLPQRCCNVATTLSIGFQGHFTTDYSDFFPFIEKRESYKSAK